MARKRILIVDDEPHIIKVLTIRLEKAGYEVIAAMDGQETLNKVRKEMPDLIILDLMLPGIDGYKVCRLLKFDERYKHIPIIVLTARVEEEDRKRSMEVGADEYITKPIKPDEFLDTIKKHLKE
ncbi:response regulator [bacterium]|nr:response regulator [bacterium]MCK4325561.1 response regulator [bacterium]